MRDDSDIPVLTDLIDENVEEEIDATLPDLGLAFDHDLIIDEDEEPGPPYGSTRTEPAMKPPESGKIADNLELEQTIRRILDEYMELAWQEIKLAIEASLRDKDKNS